MSDSKPRLCAYVGPVETGGPDVPCTRHAHEYSLWCWECTTLIGSMPQDMHAGVLRSAAERLDPGGDRAQALVSAVLESHRDDIPPRLRDLALAATVTPGQPFECPGLPEAGELIAKCTCPCCGAGIEVVHGDEPGTVGAYGKAVIAERLSCPVCAFGVLVLEGSGDESEYDCGNCGAALQLYLEEDGAGCLEVREPDAPEEGGAS